MISSKQKIKKYLFIILITICTIIFQNYLNSYLYKIAFSLYPSYKFIDPDNAFMYLFLHHFMQALVFILLILIVMKSFRLTWNDFGFHMKDYRISIKYTLVFSLIWAVLQFTIGYFIVKNGSSIDFGFVMNKKNFAGYFLFEILFSGTSEELFFRSFIITFMIVVLSKYYKSQKILNLTIFIVTNLIFMAAHMNFTLFPFEITYINGLQQLTVLIFSSFYAYLYFKTKSIFGPMLAHNLLNGVITLSQLALYMIFT